MIDVCVQIKLALYRVSNKGMDNAPYSPSLLAEAGIDSIDSPYSPPLRFTESLRRRGEPHHFNDGGYQSTTGIPEVGFM